MPVLRKYARRFIDKQDETCYNGLCKVGRAQHLIRKQVKALRQTVAVDGNPRPGLPLAAKREPTIGKRQNSP